MTRLQKLKHEARRAEQRSDWARAIQLYRSAIEIDEEEGGSASDVGLYNRVGDLYLRQGHTAAAVENYEQAIDRYSEYGLTSSAIALCNKIRRIAPEREEVYRKLGRLHASTGLQAEARAAFLQYVSRKLERQEVAEAHEAIQEYVDLTGDEEIRLTFADKLGFVERTGDAVAQLRLVYEIRSAEGGDAEEIRCRIVDLDARADPLLQVARPAPDAPSQSLDEAAAEAEPGDDAGSEAEPLSGDDAPASPEITFVPGAPSTAEYVQLGVLVGDALAADGFAGPFRPEVPGPRPALSSAPPVPSGVSPGGVAGRDLGFAELSALLARFRSQVRGVVEETDHAIHYDLGVAYLGMGLLEEAISEFRQAMESPAHLAAAHAMVGECLARQRRLAAGLTPADEKARTEEGGEADRDHPPVRERRPEDGAGEAKAADATDGPAEDASGGPLAQTGPEDEPRGLSKLLFKARLAQYRARQAGAEHRTDHVAHLELGQAYLVMKLFAEAQRELMVAATGPRSTATRAWDALQEMAGSREAPPDLRLEAIRALLEGGRTDAARTAALALKADLDSREESAEAVVELLGEIDPSSVEETGPAPSDSLAEFDRIVQEVEEGARPHSPVPTGLPEDAGPDPEEILAQGVALRAAGRTEEAVAHLFEAMELFERSRRIERAAEAVNQLLSLRPDDVVLHHQKTEFAVMMNDRAYLVQSYLDLAACLRRQSAFGAARTIYGRVLDVDPENVVARAGITALDQEELELERRRATESRRSAGSAGSGAASGSASGSRGGSAEQLEGEFDAILSELETEIELEAETSEEESHFERGTGLREAGVLEEAAREFQLALRELEDPLPAYEQLGECFVELKQYTLARRVLKQAENLAGRSEAELLGALYNLGVACELGGDPEAAREYLERVCAVDIGYRDAAVRLSHLSS